MVAFERGGMVAQNFTPIVVLGEVFALEHGAHGAVQNKNALLKQAGDGVIDRQARHGGSFVGVKQGCHHHCGPIADDSQAAIDTAGSLALCSGGRSG